MDLFENQYRNSRRQLVLHLRVTGTDDVGAGELMGEADHEATESLVAVKASVVSSNFLDGNF